MKLKIKILVLFTLFLGGCYSFTGGTIPEYLKTLYIANVRDNSGYGNPKYRESLQQDLIDEFRSDGSFQLVESGGDAKLTVSIVSITDATITVSPGELETERKITVNCEAEYYDAVKKKQIWKKRYSNFNVYEIANAFTARDEAILQSLQKTTEDILFDVVSGW